MRTAVPVIATAAACLLLAACGTGDASAGSDSTAEGDTGEQTTFTVFAAASLTDTFTELGSQFEADNPGTTVGLNFAGSSDLVSQIASGAPADVFASADEANMEKLTSENLIAGEPEIFASNTLRIVTQPDNPHHITSLQDLESEDLSVVVCAPQVPCGSATVQVTEAADVDLQPDSEENAVTDVLGKVTSGQADAGLVYVTDAIGAGDDVETVDFPESSEAINRYPIGVVTESPNAEAAQSFIDLVTSEDGQQVLSEAGFEAP